MKITFAKPELVADQAVVLFVGLNNKLGSWAGKVDKLTKGQIQRALKTSRFKGRRDNLMTIPAPIGVKASRLVIIGTGEGKTLTAPEAQEWGGRIAAAIAATGETQATLLVEPIAGSPLTETELALALAEGALLRSYRFDKYKTKEKPEQKPSLKKLNIGVADVTAARRLFLDREKVIESVNYTRDLVSEPANVLYPESFAARVGSLEEVGIRVKVLNVAEMKKLGMNALLGVGQGSVRESRLVVLEWRGAPSNKEGPLAFVGKGVCFDTGGISIKPAESMEDMKWDMAGAGVVAGLMRALALRNAPVNAVGILGLVENMPSGSAQRPGDIVTSMSGQTIEVLNTDAEGRLVLADALWYAQENYQPRLIVDLATLTGAIIVALGYEHAGLFANDETLAAQLSSAGQATGEKLWRMPMGPAYDKLIDSPAADVKNIGGGRWGGAITAAQFLARFVKKGVAWAHLDIAGVTWTKQDRPTSTLGATGFGVRLLDRFIADNFEEA
ncbi:MAG TPA: leucyl aminopeptidase [Dongiaceae bacterium]|jgi:leucyl aminopeptidase|nr:leucyl aminopeptidase [Dongiaceae bacterium]